MENQNMNRSEPRINLTIRDLILLRDLYECSVMSFEQIYKAHYQNQTRKTAYNQLLRLKMGGFIDSMRVGLMSFHKSLKSIGNVYKVTRQAARILRLKHPTEDFNKVAVFNTLNLYHDLTLNEAIAALKLRAPNHKIVRYHNAPEPYHQEQRRPDALILSVGFAPAIAVELELTEKSERRYREVIMQYRLSRRFEKVLYVTTTRPLAEKIRAIVAYKPVAGLPRPSTGKFYFIELDSLLGCPVGCEITNGEGHLFDPIEPKIFETRSFS